MRLKFEMFKSLMSHNTSGMTHLIPSLIGSYHRIWLHLPCCKRLSEDVVVFDVYGEDDSNEVDWIPEGRLRAI